MTKKHGSAQVASTAAAINASSIKLVIMTRLGSISFATDRENGLTG